MPDGKFKKLLLTFLALAGATATALTTWRGVHFWIVHNGHLEQDAVYYANWSIPVLLVASAIVAPVAYYCWPRLFPRQLRDISPEERRVYIRLVKGIGLDFSSNGDRDSSAVAMGVASKLWIINTARRQLKHFCLNCIKPVVGEIPSLTDMPSAISIKKMASDVESIADELRSFIEEWRKPFELLEKLESMPSDIIDTLDIQANSIGRVAKGLGRASNAVPDDKNLPKQKNKKRGRTKWKAVSTAITHQSQELDKCHDLLLTLRKILLDSEADCRRKLQEFFKIT